MPNRGRRIAAKKALLGKKKKSKRLSIKSSTTNFSEDLSLSSNQDDLSPNRTTTAKKRVYAPTPITNGNSDIVPAPKSLSKTASVTAVANPSKTTHKSSTQDAVYHYIRPELRRIGVCSGVVLGLLIILSFVLT